MVKNITSCPAGSRLALCTGKTAAREATARGQLQHLKEKNWKEKTQGERRGLYCVQKPENFSDSFTFFTAAMWFNLYSVWVKFDLFWDLTTIIQVNLIALLGLVHTLQVLHIHGQFRVTTLPKMHVFGLWEEVREHRENMLTPHRKELEPSSQEPPCEGVAPTTAPSWDLNWPFSECGKCLWKFHTCLVFYHSKNKLFFLM